MPPRASDLQSYIHRDRAIPQSQTHAQNQAQAQTQSAGKHASPSRINGQPPRFTNSTSNANDGPSRKKRTDRERDPFGTDVSGLLTDFENEDLDLDADGDVTVQPGRGQRWGAPPASGIAPRVGNGARNGLAHARSRFGSEIELDTESSLDGGNGNGKAIGGTGVNGNANAGNVLSWMKRTQEQDPEYAAFLEERRRGAANGGGIGAAGGNELRGIGLPATTRRTGANVVQQSSVDNQRARDAVSRNLSPRAQEPEVRESGLANGLNGEVQHQHEQGDVSHGQELVDQAGEDEQMDIDTIEVNPNTTTHVLALAPQSQSIEPEAQSKPKEYTPDYTPSQLSKMKFSSLSSQPFHSDPHSKPPQFPSELTSTASRLEHILHTSPGQANAFFASLPMDNYAECGDLLVEKVAGLVSRIVELRKEKRSVAKTCEDEVARREEVLQSEREKLGVELDRLKRAGENVVRGGE